MTNRATGIGSMPGEDFADSLQIVLGEVGDFPFLPELPARGATASMTGRALALATGLGADLQPAGWRLTDAPGIDHRRARSRLAQDLDTLEELAHAHRGPLKLQVTGPWTLAATVELPRGDKVLRDGGARRDLAQALAEGLTGHVADVARRVPGGELFVQLDEPALPGVLQGAVPTASGLHRHRSATPAEAAQALGWVVDAVRTTGATPVVHCCAADLPFAVLTAVDVGALSLDLSLVTSERYDDLAAWVEADRELWLGLVPSTHPPGPPPAAADLTRRVLDWWAELCYSDVEKQPATVLTPACGMAGASPTWARAALQTVHAVAANLSEEQGKMDA